MGLRGAININGAWLVRALANSRRVHACDHCGGRMFVKAPSGLCPICFTRRRHDEERVHALAAHGIDDAVDDWGYSS